MLTLLNTELANTLSKGDMLFQSWVVVLFIIIIAFSKDDVSKNMGKSRE